MMDKKGKGRRERSSAGRPRGAAEDAARVLREHFLQEGRRVHRGARRRERPHPRGARRPRTRERRPAHQLASDEAIRDLLRKIEDLEREKQALLSHVNEAEAHSSQFTHRHAQVEEELANLANLHVASYHLHSTLRLPAVVRHLRELLAAARRARVYGIYIADDVRNELVAIAGEGLDATQLASIPYGAGETQEDAQGFVERSFLTGIAHVEEGPLNYDRAVPPACLPMRIDDRAIGIIAIYTLFPQKDGVRRRRLRALQDARAPCGVGARRGQLFASADGRIPGVEVFRGISNSMPPRSVPAA